MSGVLVDTGHRAALAWLARNTRLLVTTGHVVDEHFREFDNVAVVLHAD